MTFYTANITTFLVVTLNTTRSAISQTKLLKRVNKMTNSTSNTDWIPGWGEIFSSELIFSSEMAFWTLRSRAIGFKTFTPEDPHQSVMGGVAMISQNAEKIQDVTNLDVQWLAATAPFLGQDKVQVFSLPYEESEEAVDFITVILSEVCESFCNPVLHPIWISDPKTDQARIWFFVKV